MSPTVLILNVGTGNIQSVYKRVQATGANVKVGYTHHDIEEADKLILPGVGHFGTVMRRLRQLELVDSLHEQVLVKKKPVLGICLGMQLFARSSEEDPTEHGLGWIDGTVEKFRVNNTLRFKVPHTGWNSLAIKKESKLFNNIPDSSLFYFVHSYHYHIANSSDVLCETTYEYPFVSAVERDNIFGMQCHPEKSHDAGTVIFHNFIHL